MNEHELKYDAFISYRHCPLDQFTAINIHKKLENFKMPKSVLPLLEGKKSKIERVFRDEDELPLSDNLSDPISKALSNTDFLIVICTPRLKESKWCQREIETFLQEHDRKHILLVLAEGEPVDSFPDILTYEEVEVTDEKGNKTIVRKEIEPLAADVRGKNHKEMLKAMDIAVIKLVAAIFSLNYDDIKQRHREQRLKNLVKIWSSISAAIFVFLVVCVFLLTKISQQKKEIEERYAGAMAVAAEELLGEGRRADALYALRQVLPEDTYINSESYRLLNAALNTYGTGEQYLPGRIFEIPSAVSEYCVSEDGSLLLVQGMHQDFYLFDTRTGEEIHRFTASYADNTMPIVAFDHDKGLIYADASSVQYLDLTNMQSSLVCENTGYVVSDPNSSVVMILAGNAFIGYDNGECLYKVDLNQYDIDTTSYFTYEYGFSSDGRYLTLAMGDYTGENLVLLMDTLNGDLISGLYFDAKGTLFPVSDGEYIFLIEDKNDGSSGKLSVVNAATAEVLGSMTLPLPYIKSVSMLNNQIVLRNGNNAVFIDARSFKITAQLDGTGLIVNDFIYQDAAMFADYMGEMYLLGEEYSYGMDVTKHLFAISPQQRIMNCLYAKERFFYQFVDANYIALYEKTEDMKREILKEEEVEVQAEFTEYKDAMSLLDQLKDVDRDYVYSAIISSDDRYLFVFMFDESVKIYDATTKKLVKTIYSLDCELLNSCVYLPKENIYVMNSNSYSYLLDQNLNYISKLDPVCSYQQGTLVVKRGGQYYLIPYVDYRENMKKADELLDEYEPTATIRKRYGI